MADDADVQDSEITPEDFDGEQEAPKTESSPVKDAKEETIVEAEAEKPEAKAEEKEEAPAKSETEAETESDDVAEETKPTKADERKTQLNTEIRDLVAQRNALKDEVSRVNSEAYQPATEEDLVSEGLNQTDAKVEALRQQMEMRDYNEKVAEAQLTIESEARKVLEDFPAFNPDSEQYDEELTTEAAELLEANLLQDPNTGQIIGSNVSPYQLYKTLARASTVSGAKGQIKGQQATEKQLANVDSNSSATPAKKASDPLTEIWSDPL
jgi:hypothetical protein